jgi:excisionase family DNA binding protein
MARTADDEVDLLGPLPERDVDGLPFVLLRAEAAQVARVSVTTIDQWTQQPGFPAHRVGRAVRIPKKAFLAWLEGRS